MMKLNVTWSEAVGAGVMVILAVLLFAIANAAFAGETGKLVASGGNAGIDRADLYEGACFAPVALAKIAAETEQIEAAFGFTPEPKAAVYTDEKTNELMDGCWFLAPGRNGPGSGAVVLVWEDGAVSVLNANDFTGADEGRPQSK